MATERSIWWLPLTVSGCVVIANVYAIIALMRSLPVRARPLKIAVVVVDLLRGTSGLFLSLFALSSSSKTDPSPDALRLCRLLALTLHWFNVTSCYITSGFLFEGLTLQRHPTVYFRRARVTWFVGCVAIYGFVTSLLPIVGWGGYSYNRKLGVCEVDAGSPVSFQVYLLVGGTLVPWLSGVLIYVKIIALAFRQSPRVRPEVDMHDVTGNDWTGSDQRRHLSAESSSFGYAGRRGAILFGFFCFSWIYVIVLRCLFISGIFGRISDGDLWIYVTMTTLGLVTSLVNPVTIVGLRGLKRSLGLHDDWTKSVVRWLRRGSQVYAGDCRLDNGCWTTVAMPSTNASHSAMTPKSQTGMTEYHNGSTRY